MERIRKMRIDLKMRIDQAAEIHNLSQKERSSYTTSCFVSQMNTWSSLKENQ